MDKGKGKRSSDGEDAAARDVPSVSGNDPQTHDSLVGRLASSTRGLAQSAFAAPTSTELSDHASSALSSAGKGSRPAGTPSSVWAESSKVSSQPAIQTASGRANGSLRTQDSEQHVRGVEEDFSAFLDGIDTFSPSFIASDGHSADAGDSISTFPTSHNRSDALRTEYARSTYLSVEEQATHDGEEVLAILSDPGSRIDEPDVTEAVDMVNWNLTEQQLTNIRAIMNELFPLAEQHAALQPDHPLNLVPPLISTHTSISPTADVEKDLSLHFGPGVTREQGLQTWMEQWDQVLTRYTDEVWGDLGPLIIDAHKELENLRKDPAASPGEVPPALRRLQQVLNHIRGT